ncbi:MAG TPA: TetR/AcrR family transcriptional regulator [Tahibacter sp.]|jgi:AcrR family transcriptional regulator|nr:TetR/AcrR family transcriptional regulator [Tahibacter sp.]
MQDATTLPSADQRQQRVRDAAIELLFELGYAVSMDAVAQRAGCSKQTVYRHFGSKEGLFRSVVSDIVAPIGASLEDDATDFPTALRTFALAHQEHLAQPRTIAAVRMFSADLARYPDDARALFEAGYNTLQTRVAASIAQAMERGELRRDDPSALAEMLLGMLVGFDVDRRRVGIPGRDTHAERQAWSDRVVTAFLRAYGNDSSTKSA